MVSTVAAICASWTGWRKAASMTAVPSRTLCVRIAIAASVVSGSRRGFAVRLSPTQTESSPACSTASAIDSSGSMLGGSSLSMTRPRVGRSMPSFKVISLFCPFL